MKCPICKGRLDIVDDELICDSCGGAFGLEYLGIYPNPVSERVDDGFEPDWWKVKYENRLRDFRKRV